MPTAPTVVQPPSATEPPITSVSVMGDTVLMGVGETVRLSLVATLSDGSTRDIDPTLAELRSSDPAVATVASDGVVTAIRAGQATISATYEQQEAELEMSVRISSHSQGSVRVMYVAPADREFRADYSAGIARAIVGRAIVVPQPTGRLDVRDLQRRAGMVPTPPRARLLQPRRRLGEGLARRAVVCAGARRYLVVLVGALR